MNDKKDISSRFIEALNELLKLGRVADKKAFALSVGCSTSMITEISKGRSNVGTSVLQNTVQIYGVSATWLLTGEGEMLEGEKNREKQEKTEKDREDQREKAENMEIPAKPKPYTQAHPEVLKVSDCPAPPLTERLLDIIQQQAEEIGRIRQKLEQYEQSNGK